MLEKDKILYQIQNSTKIYTDIRSYVDQVLHERNDVSYLYFKDSDDVKKYLEENRNFIDERLLNPTEDLWAEYELSRNAYDPKDPEFKVCPTCGTEFKGSIIKIYCSSKCWKTKR